MDSMDAYRRIAHVYDRLIEPRVAALRSIGLAMHPPASEMRVLDVGCGTGAHLERYLDAGCRVTGVDRSPAMLARARDRLGDRAELHQADASLLPFPDASFDLILAVAFLHELDPLVRPSVVGEMKRALAPDGRILVIDFHPGRLRFPKGWARRVVSVLAELAAGRTHHRNYRIFMAEGGMPALVSGHEMAMEAEKVVAGGAMGLYLVRADAAGAT
jgi:ubiquinone/menaquinone biosynthesis C-methylase UbiE